MRIHYLQHVPFEDSANIGIWAKINGHSLTNTEIFQAEPFPDIEDIDVLAVMGGLMNIYQYRDYPWLKDEKVFIEKAIKKNVKIIGVCLGAQLIADVLGAKVTQNPYIEIGWHEVKLTDAASNSKFFKDYPQTFTAIHWHGDTFSIPTGATHLAASDACSNQAFQYKDNIIALQFHIEYSAHSIDKMLEHCLDDLIDAPYIQSEEQIRQGYNMIDANTRLLSSALTQLCR